MNELNLRIRFGQIFASRLESRGLDARDWLWFHPRERDLRLKDDGLFDLLDLRKSQDTWEKYFAPEARPETADFDNVLAGIRERFVLLLIGGFGSHLVEPKIFEELSEWESGGPDAPVGQTNCGPVSVVGQTNHEPDTLSGQTNHRPDTIVGQTNREPDTLSGQTNRGPDTPVGPESGAPFHFHVPYGNTLSSNAECAKRAAETCRGILSRDDLAGKQAILLCHSKGAVIALELLSDPQYADIRQRTWGVVSCAGAIGGSPACDSLLARAVRNSRTVPAFVRKGMHAVGQAIARRSKHPLVAGLPSLSDLPDGVRDLSQKVRHAELERLEMPSEIRFFSIAAAIEREKARPESFFSKDFDRTFLYLSTYELARHSMLNDTQLLLPDAKWPDVPNAAHLATIHADHWGLVYRQVLPGAKPDPTPRLAIIESTLSLIWEMLDCEE
jgi:hypothetical protein